MTHPRDKERADKARATYAEFVKQKLSLEAQGWVLSWEQLPEGGIPYFRRTRTEEI